MANAALSSECPSHRAPSTSISADRTEGCDRTATPSQGVSIRTDNAISGQRIPSLYKVEVELHPKTVRCSPDPRCDHPGFFAEIQTETDKNGISLTPVYINYNTTSTEYAGSNIRTVTLALATSKQTVTTAADIEKQPVVSRHDFGQVSVGYICDEARVAHNLEGTPRYIVVA